MSIPLEPVHSVAEGVACQCCASVIANDDRSSCADYYGHEPHEPRVPARLLPTYPAAQLVISGEESEVAVGPCDLCGVGPSGYFEGTAYAVLSR